jgi:pyrimidine-nucleoside phosphorylase
MRIKELIQRKRDGAGLSTEEIHGLIDAFLKKEVPDYQMSAFLMAAFFQGFSREETIDLTNAMWKSGVSLERDDRGQTYWIDKHSTGGVGDKTSLLLVPIVTATCRSLGIAAKIPMISGRALAHSAGTLDKLESVPGFSVKLSRAEALRILDKEGFFMMGQTEEIAPADRRIYALRDSTSTVESVPLIVSSIMSKKLSESLDGLVLDVKVGKGAFMKSFPEARKLALSLVEVARECGVECVAFITSHDEPLGFKVGNFMEVEECADFLACDVQEAGLSEVTFRLAAQMVRMASRGSLSMEEAQTYVKQSVQNGSAYEVFKRMFAVQGGSWESFEGARSNCNDLLEYSYLSSMDGYLNRVDALEAGLLVNGLGAGRMNSDSQIDLRVGIEFLAKKGDAVKKGDVIAKIFHRSNINLEFIHSSMSRVIGVGEEPVPHTISLVLDIL